LGMFHYVIKLGGKQAEVIQLMQKVRAMKSHRNFSQQMH
jgi:hypothetical protein